MWGDGYGSWGLPFFSWSLMLVWLVLFLVIGYLVYQDANRRGMNGLLWGILVIIPMVGLVFLFLYIVIRESILEDIEPDSSNAMDILKERYAKGELTSERFKIMSENLKNISRNVWEDIDPDSLNAMGILKVRYAKGDLTSEQFKTMREDLKK